MACINSGVYRSDIPTQFKIEPQGYQDLIDRVRDTIDFFVKIEGGMNPEDIVNKEEVAQAIIEKLEIIKNHPTP